MIKALCLQFLQMVEDQFNELTLHSFNFLNIHLNMSLTFMLTGKSSVLAACYFPAVDLSYGDYEL